MSPTQATDGVAATLSYVSKDGDQNFPGTLTTYVIEVQITNMAALRVGGHIEHNRAVALKAVDLMDAQKRLALGACDDRPVRLLIPQ